MPFAKTLLARPLFARLTTWGYGGLVPRRASPQAMAVEPLRGKDFEKPPFDEAPRGCTIATI